MVKYDIPGMQKERKLILLFLQWIAKQNRVVLFKWSKTLRNFYVPINVRHLSIIFCVRKKSKSTTVDRTVVIMCISTDRTSLKTSIIIYIFVIYYFENRVEKIYWFKMLVFQHNPDMIFGVFTKGK
jgi:hypothetical protein